MKLLNEPSFGEIIQRAWELYRQNIKRLFAVALIVSVLYQLFIMFMRQSGLLDLIYQVMQEDAQGGDISSVSNDVTSTMHLVVIVGVVFYLVVLPFATAFYQNIVDDSWQGRSQSLVEHMKFIISRLPILSIATLFVYLLMMLAVMLSAKLVGILGLLVYAVFIIYIPLILYDQKNPITALSESFKLTVVAFAKTLGVTIVCYLLLNIPSIGEWAIQSLTGSGNSFVFGFDEVITIFLSAFVWPFVATLKLALYYALKAKQYNLKVQKDQKNLNSQ